MHYRLQNKEKYLNVIVIYQISNWSILAWSWSYYTGCPFIIITWHINQTVMTLEQKVRDLSSISGCVSYLSEVWRVRWSHIFRLSTICVKLVLSLYYDWKLVDMLSYNYPNQMKLSSSCIHKLLNGLDWN